MAQINPTVNGQTWSKYGQFGGGSITDIRAPWYDLLGQPSMTPMVDGTVDLRKTHEQFPAAMTGLLKKCLFLNELTIYNQGKVFI